MEGASHQRTAGLAAPLTGAIGSHRQQCLQPVNQLGDADRLRWSPAATAAAVLPPLRVGSGHMRKLRVHPLLADIGMAAFERLEPKRGHSRRHNITTVLDPSCRWLAYQKDPKADVWS
jgi:hypothetical protein